MRAQLNDHDYLLPQVQAAIIEGGLEIPRGEDATAFPAFRFSLLTTAVAHCTKRGLM